MARTVVGVTACGQPGMPGAQALMTKRGSKGQYGAYDRAPQGDLPAAVCIQLESGQFPLAVLGMVRQQAPGGVSRRSSWQVQHEVGVLGHHLLLCAAYAVVQSAVAKYSPAGLSGAYGDDGRGPSRGVGNTDAGSGS